MSAQVTLTRPDVFWGNVRIPANDGGFASAPSSSSTISFTEIRVPFTVGLPASISGALMIRSRQHPLSLCVFGF